MYDTRFIHTQFPAASPDTDLNADPVLARMHWLMGGNMPPGSEPCIMAGAVWAENDPMDSDISPDTDFPG